MADGRDQKFSGDVPRPLDGAPFTMALVVVDGCFTNFDDIY